MTVICQMLHIVIRDSFITMHGITVMKEVATEEGTLLNSSGLACTFFVHSKSLFTQNLILSTKRKIYKL
jgi:hypothetical protein